MTRRHRSFAAKKPNSFSDDEKISFDLDEEYTFVCKDDLQGAVILDFVAAADEGATRAAAKIMNFFKEALPEKEHERFLEVIHGDKLIVDMELLSEIVGFLIEEYTGRPTEESE